MRQPPRTASEQHRHPRSSVDQILSESGIVRHVPVVVPGALAALAIASGSDLIATVPAAVAKWNERTMKVVVKQSPLPMPPMTMFQSWIREYQRTARTVGCVNVW